MNARIRGEAEATKRVFSSYRFVKGDPQLTVATTNPDADPQLRRNSLGFPELVFQGVTHIAPATNVVFTFPIIALKAGPAMPLSFLL